MLDAAWWVVAKAGDIDFLAKNWKVIIGIIVAPWFSVVVVVIGLGLIFWNSKRKDTPAARGRIGIAELKRIAVDLLVEGQARGGRRDHR